MRVSGDTDAEHLNCKWQKLIRAGSEAHGKCICNRIRVFHKGRSIKAAIMAGRTKVPVHPREMRHGKHRVGKEPKDQIQTGFFSVFLFKVIAQFFPSVVIGKKIAPLAKTTEKVGRFCEFSIIVS